MSKKLKYVSVKQIKKNLLYEPNGSSNYFLEYFRKRFKRSKIELRNDLIIIVNDGKIVNHSELDVSSRHKTIIPAIVISKDSNKKQATGHMIMIFLSHRSGTITIFNPNGKNSKQSLMKDIINLFPDYENAEIDSVNMNFKDDKNNGYCVTIVAWMIEMIYKNPKTPIQELVKYSYELIDFKEKIYNYSKFLMELKELYKGNDDLTGEI